MSKKFGSVTKLIDLKTMDSHILVFKEFCKLGRIDFWIKKAESLSKKSIETRVGTFLSTTFQNHIA